MIIRTSSWYTRLPSDHIRIGISRFAPRGLPAGYRLFKLLAPGPWFNSVSADEYRTRYFDEILAKLDPAETVEMIKRLANGATPVLCCFESPTKDADWCHRGYVSAWLKDTIGLDVFELGHEDRGCGWSHPKLPAHHRNKPAIDGAQQALAV